MQKSVEDVKGLKYVQFISLTGNGNFEIPDDAEEVNYYYQNKDNASWIGLYTEKTDADIAEENQKNERMAKEEQKRTIHSEFAKRAFQLRKEFVRYVSISDKNDMEELMRFAFVSIMKNQSNYQIVTDDEFCMFAGLGKDDVNGTISSIISKEFQMPSKRALFLVAYCNFHDSERESYSDYSCEYKVNEKLEIIYNFLEKLGYECSDEEKAWREGTHEIFIKNEDLISES